LLRRLWMRAMHARINVRCLSGGGGDGPRRTDAGRRSDVTKRWTFKNLPNAGRFVLLGQEIDQRARGKQKHRHEPIEDGPEQLGASGLGEDRRNRFAVYRLGNPVVVQEGSAFRHFPRPRVHPSTGTTKARASPSPSLGCFLSPRRSDSAVRDASLRMRSESERGSGHNPTLPPDTAHKNVREVRRRSTNEMLARAPAMPTRVKSTDRHIQKLDCVAGWFKFEILAP
jgi:hypothetical protein